MNSREITLASARGKLAALRWTAPPQGADAPVRVLALHGWLDNAASFAPLAPHLVGDDGGHARGIDLVALDLPGHGASAHRAPGYDYAFVDWIHDVLDALDALGWERAVLLGHSMGGGIASLVAASVPARVERLALIEALGPIGGRVEDAVTRLRTAVAARRVADAATRGGNAARLVRTLPSREVAIDARLAASAMTREAAALIVDRNLRAVPPEDGKPGGVAWRSDPRLKLPGHVRSDEATVQAWLGAIECPVLVLAADPAPPYFSPSIRDARVHALRDGRVVEVAGGHHLHMEQAEAVAAVLRPFLVGAD
jgi:pimeloyl-ACP methyl ester carboxylesterase